MHITSLVSKYVKVYFFLKLHITSLSIEAKQYRGMTAKIKFSTLKELDTVHFTPLIPLHMHYTIHKLSHYMT